ncbi:MAG: phenylalanine--tRNA ligase subunit alpha, partial [Clostridia bacterium]|nr:phenylalanine--tRNA ligase subunit alpha [Clostridia bacterium]
MKQQIENIKQQFTQELETAQTVAQLQELRVKYVGKSGVVTGLLRQIKDVAPSDRAMVGNMINDLRKSVEESLAKTETEFAEIELQNKLKAEQIDISLLNSQQWGTRHPIDKVKDEIIDLFKGIGFEVCEGPELETDYYNFQALNIPLEHPSRDMQDTFYINDNILLRTQTSAMQARLMEKKGPPIKMLCPGKVFRADSDASH